MFFFHEASNKLGINDDRKPTYQLDVKGTIRASGNVIAYSDVRAKKNIKTIETPLAKVLALRGVTFEWKDDKQDWLRPELKSRVGLIAQEVEKVLPEVVFTDPKVDDEKAAQQFPGGFKNVSYGNIVGLLIEAIKEQQGQINKLEEKLTKLEKE
jgi:hypothetical protein